MKNPLNFCNPFQKIYKKIAYQKKNKRAQYIQNKKGFKLLPVIIELLQFFVMTYNIAILSRLLSVIIGFELD